MNQHCANCLHWTKRGQCEIAHKTCSHLLTLGEIIEICQKCGWRTPAVEVKSSRAHSATTGEWAIWLERNS